MLILPWLLPVVTLLISPSLANPATSPCVPNHCGNNTSCHLAAGRAVCSCLPGYYGSPLVSCVKGECSVNADCPGQQACISYKCKDICEDICGTNAKCEAQDGIPVCSCPAGYSGDPFVSCHAGSLCKPSPCGRNTQCNVVNNVPVCSCLPGFIGSALQGCRAECESNSDCHTTQICSNHHCVSACSRAGCGTNALCTGRNHVAVCTCPPGYVGNPHQSCRPECADNPDCPEEKPVCWYNRCINPCNGVCGTNAKCRIKNKTPICSCPKGYTGNPKKFCRPITHDDYCIPNPCGENAVCQPGYDNTGEMRPVCTCPPGYIGNALLLCRRGECLTNEECSLEQVCDISSYTCRHGCRGACGVWAECIVRNHVPLCACPAGYTGDASVACQPLLSTQRLVY